MTGGVTAVRSAISTTMVVPDIYVTNYGENRLYRNNHDGTFTDDGREGWRHDWHLVNRRYLWRLRWRWAS